MRVGILMVEIELKPEPDWMCTVQVGDGCSSK